MRASLSRLVRLGVVLNLLPSTVGTNDDTRSVVYLAQVWRRSGRGVVGRSEPGVDMLGRTCRVPGTSQTERAQSWA